jgi:photosystem II stability/assembly factor-like uncharacterized protein
MDRNARRVAVCGLAAMAAMGAGVNPAAAAVQPPVFSKVATPIGDGDVLAGVACMSAASCIAVGSSDHQPHSHGSVPVVERWDGASWSLGEAVQREDYTVFQAIACPTAADCFAVGSSQLDIGGHGPQSLVERWNGSTWSIVPSPNPGLSGSSLRAIACPDEDHCIAVGSSDSSALVETWNGSKWSAAIVASGARRPQLDGVACATASDCVAVGQAGASTLTMHWDGTKWSRTRTPDPGGSAVLGAVACSTVDFCTAVGSVSSPQGHAYDEALIEHWNGRSWSLDSVPTPSPQRGTLSAVTCPGARRCVAVGWQTDVDGFSRVLIDASNGRRWSAAAGPLDKGDVLLDVACTNVGHCVAVGDLWLGPDDPGGLVAVSRPPR